MGNYIPRIVDGSVQLGLKEVGAIVLEGPRACGKTVTGLKHSSSFVRVDQEIEDQPRIREHPEILIPGETPRLLDEWQTLTPLWNLVRREVDKRNEPGQFILTGSSTPQDDSIRHSGAGRFSRIRMRPLTLLESGHSKGVISIGDLLNGTPIISGSSSLDIYKTIELIVRGGWPTLINKTERITGRWVRDYIGEITRVDIANYGVSRQSRDPLKIERVLKSLARNIGGDTRIATIVADTAGEDGVVSREAVVAYLDALQRVFLLELIPAWHAHFRSKTELRTSPKHYFVDPSIGPAALKLTTEKLIKDLNYLGHLFENLVVRDLHVYSQAIDGRLSYYRDKNGLEVDLIVEGMDGNWIAVEIKMGQHAIDEAAANLISFLKKVDTSKMSEPNALVVVTGSGYAYTREDRVHVIPIDLLGP